MKNAEWMIKNGMSFSNLKCAYINGKNIVYYDDYPHELLYFEYGQPKDIVTKWLDMEHREQILDDVEKRYLKGVIRPFRDRVQYIVKTNNGCSRGYCGIRIGFANPRDDIYLPCFLESTMYKGMKMYDAYSLEELGL